MPVYLLHGFRWPRPLIRIHIILHKLDDAAAEWIVAPGTTVTILENFNEVFPEAMENLSGLRFVEQYDPEDDSPAAGSQPYAYVADVVHDIKLGVDVDEVRGGGVSNEQWAALLELRDKIAPEEKVGWFVVVCGDEERLAPVLEEEDMDSEMEESALPPVPVSMGPPAVPMPGSGPPPALLNGYHHYDAVSRPRTSGSAYTSASSRTTKEASSPEMMKKDSSSPEMPRRRRSFSRKLSLSSTDNPQNQGGFRKLLGTLTRRKSRASIKDVSSPISTHSQFDAPPVPSLPRTAA